MCLLSCRYEGAVEESKDERRSNCFFMLFVDS